MHQTICYLLLTFLLLPQLVLFVLASCPRLLSHLLLHGCSFRSTEFLSWLYKHGKLISSL